MKYQHKIEVFEAVQWTGDNFDEVRAFAPSADINSGVMSVRDWDNDRRVVAVGYYIVAHPLGGHYAISPTVFGRGYEPVSATLQSQLAASQERETVSMNSDNLCTPHKIFLNSQNLTGCVLCERNKEIEDLKAQLAASQERERIFREGLEKYAHTGNWAHTEMNYQYRNWWMRWENGYDIAETTLKAAEEVK